jgi:hypothetical protein
LESSLVAAQQAVSQEGLSSMKLVSLMLLTAVQELKENETVVTIDHTFLEVRYPRLKANTNSTPSPYEI